MANCPISGLPCPHNKCIHITDCGKNYEAISQKDLCALCGIGFIEHPETLDVKKVAQKTTKAIAELLSFLVNNKPSNIPSPAPVNVKSCSGCGFTLYDIAEKGKTGCGQCYKDFIEELKPLIFKCQNCLEHKGKIPKSIVKNESIEELELELKTAIQKEDYENAAKIRDQLNKLK